MKQILFNIIILVLLTNKSFSKEIMDCTLYNKLSTEYLKCKTQNLKNSSISQGQKFIKDTKDYQKEEWTEEKIKIDNAKKKYLKINDRR